MNVFVTGATGFVGSHLINYLISQNIDVYAQLRINSKPKLQLIKEPHWIEGEYEKLNFEILPKVDALIHLAAHSANYPYDSLQNCIKFNIEEPLNLFERARLAGTKRFLIAGTCFEYGVSGEKYDFIPVNAPLLPTQTYPASKAMSSIAFAQFAIENKLLLSYHRLFQVFGEGELESRLWPSLRKAARLGLDFPMTKGEQVRDFIHVKEVAKHFYQNLFAKIIEGEPMFYNVGSGKPQTILEFSKYWWEKWNAKGKLKVGEIDYRKGEVMRFVPE